MLKFIAFYGGLFALVGLAVLGAAQSSAIPDVGSLGDLTVSAN